MAPLWQARVIETEIGQMTEKKSTQSMSKAQREQQKLLKEALKRPGVAVAVEAYGRVQAYTPAHSTGTAKSGYATGGNAA